jgi:hypothetical protein
MKRASYSAAPDFRHAFCRGQEDLGGKSDSSACSRTAGVQFADYAAGPATPGPQNIYIYQSC